MLITVHNSWHNRVSIGARADDEQDNQQKRLKVEQGRHLVRTA